jgi:hypothetical protein
LGLFLKRLWIYFYLRLCITQGPWRPYRCIISEGIGCGICFSHCIAGGDRDKNNDFTPEVVHEPVKHVETGTFECTVSNEGREGYLVGRGGKVEAGIEGEEMHSKGGRKLVQLG